jgi:hypothetical protein
VLAHPAPDRFRGVVLRQFLGLHGFRKRPAKVDHHKAEGRADDERHTPAPVGHDGSAEHQGRQPADQRGEQDARVDVEGDDAGDKAFASLGDEFDRVGGGQRGFNTRGDALDDAADQQDDAGGGTDLVVGGAEGNDQGGAGHHHDGPEHDPASSDAVGQGAEHDSAEGTECEADGEDCKRAQRCGNGVLRREKLWPDESRQKAKDHPVVPFEGVAEPEAQQPAAYFWREPGLPAALYVNLDDSVSHDTFPSPGLRGAGGYGLPADALLGSAVIETIVWLGPQGGTGSPHGR